jgi:hypothetical protein
MMEAFGVEEGPNEESDEEPDRERMESTSKALFTYSVYVDNYRKLSLFL